MQLRMFLIAPIMGLLAGLSPLLVELMFDVRWAGAVPYLQMLCVVGVLYPMHALNINLLNVKGRSDLVLKVGFVKKSVNLTLLFVAIPFGVIGIVTSQVIGSFLALIPNTYFSARLVGYSFFDQIKDVMKPLIAGTLAGLSSWFVSQTGTSILFLSLFFSSVVGVAVYLLASLLLSAEGARIVWNKVSNRLA